MDVLKDIAKTFDPFAYQQKKKAAGTYGQNGSESVHFVLTQIAEELILVLILSAMAARGGSIGAVATAIMAGIAILWALNNLGNSRKGA
jgi:cell division protein ZapA (FtsZ GTPase activity inhibitor)